MYVAVCVRWCTGRFVRWSRGSGHGFGGVGGLPRNFVVFLVGKGVGAEQRFSSSNLGLWVMRSWPRCVQGFVVSRVSANRRSGKCGLQGAPAE